MKPKATLRRVLTLAALSPLAVSISGCAPTITEHMRTVATKDYVTRAADQVKSQLPPSTDDPELTIYEGEAALIWRNQPVQTNFSLHEYAPGPLGDPSTPRGRTIFMEATLPQRHIEVTDKGGDGVIDYCSVREVYDWASANRFTRWARGEDSIIIDKPAALDEQGGIIEWSVEESKDPQRVQHTLDQCTSIYKTFLAATARGQLDYQK